MPDDDPFGLIEAETQWETSPRLLKCSQDKACPEHAQALFWVAAHTLSEASAEEREIDAADYGLKKNMTVEEILEIMTPQIDDIIPNGPPNYASSDPVFIRGLKLMHAAHDAGSLYAGNELGLLFMQEESLKDFNIAERYLTDAFKRGDGSAAYNLARLAQLRDPADHGSILKHLKNAAETEQGNLKIMYMLGREAFGVETDVLIAKHYLRENEDAVQNARRHFESHFGRASR